MEEALSWRIALFSASAFFCSSSLVNAIRIGGNAHSSIGNYIRVSFGGLAEFGRSDQVFSSAEGFRQSKGQRIASRPPCVPSCSFCKQFLMLHEYWKLPWPYEMTTLWEVESNDSTG